MYVYINKQTNTYTDITMKFRENFDTPESHENWYIEVPGHAGHESGLSFFITIMTIISITISPKPKSLRVGNVGLVRLS